MRSHHLPRDPYNRHAYLSNFRGKSLRLPDHDYSAPGVYHVINCAKGINGRAPLFAHPVLNQLLKTHWIDLPIRFPGIQLDEFVVMPDHIHFVIWVNKWPERLPEGERPPYLWQIMQAYKSKVAVEWIDYVKANHPTWSAKIWQKKFYERIIRPGELNRVRFYIRGNPDKAKNQPIYVGWETLYERMGWEKPF
jgi:putative transposase